MRQQDLVLFAVIFVSMGAAIAFPACEAYFHPYIMHYMMALLFLSFLRIDVVALLQTSLWATVRLTGLIAVKLIVLPVVLFLVTSLLLPEYAVPVLLLSGVSTGVVAPFIATLVSADLAPVLRMVVVTSLLVPFSLPLLVKILAGAEITISLEAMMRMLTIVVFVPMASVAVLRRLSPTLVERILARQFPISLALFALSNLGVFSKYSSFFFQHPGELLVCLAVAYGLSLIYYGIGFLLAFGRRPQERLASGVSLAIMNNVLVIVFSSQFFGPLSPTLAAMYMFPFYTMIVPVKLLAVRLGWLPPASESNP